MNRLIMFKDMGLSRELRGLSYTINLIKPFMNIFVVNSGSSSIKYQLFRMPVEKPVCSGLAERIGLENSVITHKIFFDQEEKIIKRTIDLAARSGETFLLQFLFGVADERTKLLFQCGA